MKSSSTIPRAFPPAQMSVSELRVSSAAAIHSLKKETSPRVGRGGAVSKPVLTAASLPYPPEAFKDSNNQPKVTSDLEH